MTDDQVDALTLDQARGLTLGELREMLDQGQFGLLKGNRGMIDAVNTALQRHIAGFRIDSKGNAFRYYEG